jgi:threonine dehydrogenase-like Zn-dependent dehydrogenase
VSTPPRLGGPVKLIASGAVNTAPLAADVYPLASLQDAFEAARERREPKISVDLLGVPG